MVRTQTMAHRAGRRTAVAVALLAAALAATAAAVALGTPREAGAQEAARPPGFAVECDWRWFGKEDPIVSPGEEAMHAHEGFGGYVNRHSTRESMLASSTSCEARGDHSGYWQPMTVNAGGLRIKPTRMVAYFRVAPGVDHREVWTWPAGYQIVAGGRHMGTEPSPRVNWTCGGDNGDGTPADVTPYPRDCGENRYPTVRYVFPDCVETGPDARIDSGDHRSHARYSNGDGCPAGYRPIPQLTTAYRYPEKFNPSYATFSSGGWQSLHADFKDAFVRAKLELLIREGIRDGSGLSAAETAEMG